MTRSVDVKRLGGRSFTIVRLRRVVFLEKTELDFRSSDCTMWNSLPTEFRRRLRPHDAACFVNAARTLLRVIFKPVRGASGLTSVQHRYTGRRVFVATTLQNVAHDLGIHFEGVKTFEEQFSELM